MAPANGDEVAAQTAGFLVGHDKGQGLSPGFATSSTRRSNRSSTRLARTSRGSARRRSCYRRTIAGDGRCPECDKTREVQFRVNRAGRSSLMVCRCCALGYEDVAGVRIGMFRRGPLIRRTRERPALMGKGSYPEAGALGPPTPGLAHPDQPRTSRAGGVSRMPSSRVPTGPNNEEHPGGGPLGARVLIGRSCPVPPMVVIHPDARAP